MNPKYATALALFIAFSSVAQARVVVCRDVFLDSEQRAWETVNKEIRPTDETVDFSNDRSYLREEKRLSSVGIMRSRYSRKYETRFYFAATAQPNSRGEIPLVDPKSKGVYIFLHGSGTMKSSGRNFDKNLNNLSQLGFSALSFDMPFHMEGPRRESMNDPEVFMKWFESIMTDIRAQAGDKPIYLVGHSFGPEVIAEYLFRNPRAVQGAALISPAAFNPELVQWYDKYTSKMKFGGDVAENSMAGQWSATVAEGFRWNKSRGSGDPTRVNPALRVRVLTGDREEYVPGPLNAKGLPGGPNNYDFAGAIHKHLAGATVTVEKGVGHYIFDHVDARGQNAVLREYLALADISPSDIGTLTKENAKARNRVGVDQAAYNYGVDTLFRSWVDATFSSRAFLSAVERRDDRFIDRIVSGYGVAKMERELSIGRDIVAFAESDPAFYARFKVGVDSLKKNPNKPDSSLFRPYLEALENASMRK